MGNFALQAAVESWFSHGKSASVLFDEVFLAAADERFNSFELPMAARLSRLADLTPRIFIYYSVRDIALYLSFAVNLFPRLGHEGPVHKTDAARLGRPPLAPAEQALDVREVEGDIGGAAVIALATVGGRLHLAQQRLHLGG
jgi:hypothetical protein